jgi:hypothetical protein
MRITVAIAVFISLLVAAVPSVRGEVRIDPLRSSGLGLDGRMGCLSAQDSQDQFVVSSDESPISLLFFWDSRDLAPLLKVEKKGAPQVEFDLTAGNRIRLTGVGEFVCTISARKGTGHWACVVLSGREWDS